TANRRSRIRGGCGSTSLPEHDDLMTIRNQLFIDGRFVDAASGQTLPTLNPHDNSVIAQVAMAGREDVDRAVDAAEKAFPAWRRMAAADRGAILLRLSQRIPAQ